jgi:protease-4
MSMKLRYPFLYLVLASGLIAGALLVFNADREDPVISSSVLARDRVAVINVIGVITSSHDVSKGTSSSRRIIEQLEKYGENDSVKAVVLRIDSPGGTVVAAQEVYGAVNRLRRETGKAVVVSMADIAASGGYYISCAADRIFANPGTITGSIGVIMEFPNLEGLFGKVGIRTTTIKSGEFKDTGNALREMTDRERRLLQDLIDDVFTQFVDAVEKGREMEEEEVRALADGRIFTGR